MDVHIVTFDIHSKLKGSLLEDTISIETALPNGVNCGVFFQDNTTYLVYAYIMGNETLGTSSCSGNSIVSSDYQPSYMQSIVLGSISYYLISLWWLVPIVLIPVIIIVIFIKKRK